MQDTEHRPREPIFDYFDVFVTLAGRICGSILNCDLPAIYRHFPHSSRSKYQTPVVNMSFPCHTP
jgi:hypothetical protein